MWWASCSTSRQSVRSISSSIWARASTAGSSSRDRVTARPAGKWTWRHTSGHDVDLALKQNFQKIEGTLTAEGRSVPIEDARLTRDAITFVAKTDAAGSKQEFSGHIVNHAIEGTVRTSK